MPDARGQSILARLVTLPARRPRAALLLALVATVLAALGIRRLTPDASLQSMMDARDPSARAMASVLRNFSAVEDLLVLVSVPPAQRGDASGGKRRLLAFADRFENAVRAAPQAAAAVEAIAYRPDAQTREFFERVLVPAGMFYLDDDAFAAARQRLTREGMVEQVARNEAMIAAPGPAAEALASALLRDPLRLHEFLLAHLAKHMPMGSGGGAPVGPKGEPAPYLSPDGHSLLIRVIGKQPLGDLEFAKRITSIVGDLARQANTDGLEIDLTGGYAIAAASERAIRRDMTASVIGSVVLLQLLFIVAYRRPVRLFLLAFAPVAVGILWGFGAYSIFWPTISPATAVVGAILAGMGTDYAVFYLSHYESAGGASIDSARRTSVTLLAPLVAAWATSIIGFAAIGHSGAQALRDFSLIGVLGLSGALLATFWIVPAVLVLIDRRRTEPSTRRRVRIDMEPVLHAVARHRRAAIGITLGIFVVAMGVILAPGDALPLESDLTVMHPRPNPALAAQAKLAERMGTDPGSLLIHLSAASDDELLRVAHRVDRALQSSQVRAAGVVSTYGLASLLPDPDRPALRLSAVTPQDAQRVVADFRSVITESSFSSDAYKPYAGFLQTLLTNTHPPGVPDLARYPRLSETMLGKTGHEAITLVFLDRSLDDRAHRTAAVTALREALAPISGVTLTGLSVIQLDTEQTIHRELPRLMAIAGGLVTAYLLVHFRSVTATLLSMVPLAFSLAVLVALMRLTGQKLNMMNLVSIPLLIGIDVDYGIYLVSLARRSQREGTDLTAGIASTCHAICVAALTAALGFGSLAFTSVPAIRSLGWAVGIGVAACLLATLVLLAPVLISLARRRTALVMLAAGLLLTSTMLGCAPTARLSFPTKPIIERDGRSWFDVNRDGKPDFAIAQGLLSYDDDEDGRVDRAYRLSNYADDAVPHVIILLDSVPYESAAEFWKAGGLCMFDCPPQKVIAPFPSLTEVCYTAVLHTPPLGGMTDGYYDPRAGKRHGGMSERFGGHWQPWERRLDYCIKYYEGGLSFLDPRPWYAGELERMRRAIDASPNRVTIVYAWSAAAMACKYGRDGVRETLEGAEQLCLQLLYERHGAIKISLMADHGHNLVASKNVHVDEFLRDAGFRSTDRLRRDNDVVLELNGLVTYAGVQTTQPRRVAQALVAHPEIAQAMYLDGDRVIVRDASGAAAIECHDQKLGYVPIDHDVLGYQSVLGSLKLDANGCASDADWFAATIDHEYPDAPRRIWDAFHGEVVNPPTVIFTLRDGYCAGQKKFEGMIRMASTHGSLNQLNSATFVMTMIRDRVRGPLRSRDVLGQLESGYEPPLRR